jgi:hypothetical protein
VYREQDERRRDEAERQASQAVAAEEAAIRAMKNPFHRTRPADWTSHAGRGLTAALAGAVFAPGLALAAYLTGAGGGAAFWPSVFFGSSCGLLGVVLGIRVLAKGASRRQQVIAMLAIAVGILSVPWSLLTGLAAVLSVWRPN